MKFGMLLLGILTLACVLGSVIPQGNSLDWYLQQYGPRTGALIYGLGLEDVFHSPWFLVLTVILCCNLLLCNLLHLPALLRRWREAADPDRVMQVAPTVTVSGLADPAPVFAALGMKPLALEREGRQLRCAVKNRLGLWGAWVCHLGILLLILGFVLGQTNKVEYTVYGVPGQTKEVGDTGYQLTIEAFDVELTESGMPSQYTARITMAAPDGEAAQSAEVSVNDPASLFGYKVYQNSTGSAARLTVLRDGEVLQEEVLSAGDYLVIENTPVAVFFEAYEAEAEFADGQIRPAYAYSLYDMSRDTRSETRYQAEGEKAIETSVYSLQFSEPQSYTLLQLKRDPFTWLVLAGGLVVMLGLILAFYLQPKRLWAEQAEDGSWTLSGSCRKAGPLFAEQIRELCQAHLTRKDDPA